MNNLKLHEEYLMSINGDFMVDKNTKALYLCDPTMCDECLFRNEECGLARLCWLFAEAEPSDMVQEILDTTQCYNVDEDGKLHKGAMTGRNLYVCLEDLIDRFKQAGLYKEW